MLKGNVFVSLDDQHGVFFHTAKCGLQIPKIVHQALKRSESKWGNSGAVARVIFNEMTCKDPFGLDGFGIVSEVVDNDCFILSINDRIQKIGIMTEDMKLVNFFTFEKYLQFTLLGLEWKSLCRDSYDHVFERYGSHYAQAPSFNLTDPVLRRAGF
jgi:hypothetical protein